MRPLARLLLLSLAMSHPLEARQSSDTVFALRECESSGPNFGPMRADGMIAAMLAPDGRIDTATTRVLQVESMSVPVTMTMAVSTAGPA
jgi:hypothetical protein